VTVNVNFNVEQDIKDDAEKILAQMGLSLEDALNLFLLQVLLFDPNARYYKTAEEMFADLPQAPLPFES